MKKAAHRVAPHHNERVLARERNLLFTARFRLLFQRYASALLLSTALRKFIKATKNAFFFVQKPPRLPVTETGAVRSLYGCFFRRSRDPLQGIIAARAGAKIAERWEK